NLTALLLLLFSSSLIAGDFVSITFNDFIRFVSSETQTNYVIDESIDKKFSIFLPDSYKSSDSKLILDSILEKNNFKIRSMGTLNYIYKTDIDKSFFSLDTRFILPTDIESDLKKNFSNIHFSFVKRKILFYSSYQDFKDIQTFINLVDLPVKQRKIKISIFYTSDNALKEFGANLKTNFNDQTTQAAFDTVLASLSGSQAISFSLDNFSIDSVFNFMNSNGLVNYQFQPIISISDNKDSIFDDVKNIPYLSASNSIDGNQNVNTNSYNYKDVGIRIKLTNVSICDDAVYFNIELAYETILANTATPQVTKRYISSYQKIESGKSVLISGIKSTEEKNVHSEFLLLSWIPYLGDLFKFDSKSLDSVTFSILLQNVDESAFEDVLSGAPRLRGE
ncbi:MAG: hypothetical protein IE909_15130, partial [Campylobacterales bacterium]|nr:hypothetical protein [Campylobacterales bacterium]